MKKPLGKPVEYRIDNNISDKIINDGVAYKNNILKNEFNDLLKSEVFGSLINPGNECNATMDIQKNALAYVISIFLFNLFILCNQFLYFNILK